MSLHSETVRSAGLVGYKAVSDIVGKASVLAILMIAARTMSARDFGLLALATTLGWIASVASDFGLHWRLPQAHRSPMRWLVPGTVCPIHLMAGLLSKRTGSPRQRSLAH